ERLNSTEFTQPALFAHSLAVIAAADIKGDFVLGHSLGELPALVHAGVLSLSDGVKIVQKRGELMSQSESGKMAAVIGMDYADLIELCESVSDDSVKVRSEEHTSELQSRFDLVCRLLLEKKKENTSRKS